MLTNQNSGFIMTFSSIRTSLQSIWDKPEGMQGEDFDSEATHSFAVHYVIRPLVQAALKEKCLVSGMQLCSLRIVELIS